MTAEDAFTQFYEATSRSALSQAYALVGDFREAQDLVQEAYLRAWAHWERVSTYQEPSSWVYLVIRRMAVSRWRRLRTQAKALGRARVDDDSSTSEPSDDVVLVVRALEGVPFKQREVLVLHYLADLPVDVIAARLGRPIGTVKAQLSRGRASLGALLEDDREPSTVKEH